MTEAWTLLQLRFVSRECREGSMVPCFKDRRPRRRWLQEKRRGGGGAGGDYTRDMGQKSKKRWRKKTKWGKKHRKPRAEDRDVKKQGVQEWVRELKRWLGCSLRGRIWLAMANQRAACKQPVDKCEIWFLSHLTAALHYECTQITCALPLHSPHEGRRWLTLLSGWMQHQWLVLTWHLSHLKTEMDVQ